jgi:beta-glucanase (GH16 family)
MRSLPRRVALILIAACAVLLPSAPAVAASLRPPAGPNCGPTISKPAGGIWTCTFDDEFSGSSLDTSKWSPVTTASSGLVGGSACFVDSRNNISVSGGHLNLTARQESRSSVCSPYTFSTPYTAGQVATTGKFFQTYGRFSVRARFPATTVAGLQSALWMWPQNAQSGVSGEIDIAEEYSQYADRAVPYLHYAVDPTTVNALTDTNVVTNENCLISDVGAFHEYTAEVTSTTVSIFYDGNLCLRDNYLVSGLSPFNQPFFLILTQTLGLGTNALQPGVTPLPATTSVDWVRAWK